MNKRLLFARRLFSLSLGLFLFAVYLNVLAQPTYKVNFCSGSKPARLALKQYLNTYRNDSPEEIIPYLQHWAKQYRMAVAIIELQRNKDQKYFHWHSRQTRQGSHLVEQQPAVLGTRSIEPPTADDIACFFSDTLVVADTLRLLTGRAVSYQFVVRTATGEWIIPRDKVTGELLVFAPTSNKAEAGHYISAHIWSKAGNQTLDVGQGIFYFLSSDERRQVRAALLNRLDEKTQCDTMLGQALPFLESMWGAKHCDYRGLYDLAQAASLKRLLGRCH